MGYLHYTCTWVELDAHEERSGGAGCASPEVWDGRPGTTARVYKKYEKESLTTNPPGDKLGSNKESLHATPPLPSQGQSLPVRRFIFEFDENTLAIAVGGPRG
jgi:hypothetical protein